MNSFAAAAAAAAYYNAVGASANYQSQGNQRSSIPQLPVPTLSSASNAIGSTPSSVNAINGISSLNMNNIGQLSSLGNLAANGFNGIGNLPGIGGLTGIGNGLSNLNALTSMSAPGIGNGLSNLNALTSLSAQGIGNGFSNLSALNSLSALANQIPSKVNGTGLGNAQQSSIPPLVNIGHGSQSNGQVQNPLHSLNGIETGHQLQSNAASPTSPSRTAGSGFSPSQNLLGINNNGNTGLSHLSQLSQLSSQIGQQLGVSGGLGQMGLNLGMNMNVPPSMYFPGFCNQPLHGVNGSVPSWNGSPQNGSNMWNGLPLPNSYGPYSGSGYPLNPITGAPGSALDLGATRRKNATKETTSTLKAWLQEHIKNPYPTKGEKIMLAIITKMTLTQVSTWFANARRRLKKENKMTWSPRNRVDSDSGSLDGNEDGDADGDMDVEKGQEQGQRESGSGPLESETPAPGTLELAAGMHWHHKQNGQPAPGTVPANEWANQIERQDASNILGNSDNANRSKRQNGLLIIDERARESEARSYSSANINIYGIH